MQDLGKWGLINPMLSKWDLLTLYWTLEDAAYIIHFPVHMIVLKLAWDRLEKFKNLSISPTASDLPTFWESRELPILLPSVQFSSVHLLYHVQLFATPCTTPGLPVHHQLPEFIQTHVHWVDDAIQPSHPLSSAFSPALNLSQHQGLFKWVSSLHQMAKVLEFQLQYHSFQWTSRTDFL